MGAFRILLQACPLYIAEIAPKSQRGAMILVLVSFTLIASVVSYPIFVQLLNFVCTVMNEVILARLAMSSIL